MYSLRLLIFKIEDDFRLAVVDDSLAVFTVVKGEKVVEILRCAHGRAAVSAYDLKDLKNKLCGKSVARTADELPALVDEDGLLIGAVLLCLRTCGCGLLFPIVVVDDTVLCVLSDYLVQTLNGEICYKLIGIARLEVNEVDSVLCIRRVKDMTF